MIISRTPLRISFFGGGTDFRSFFRQEAGIVITSTIDKYIYVIVKERFDDRIRVGYTRTELVDRIDDLQHELVRECLRRTGISRRIEIATMGDIPSAGSGLGSSSTVTVGLLNAFYHYLGNPKECLELAREACEIELDVLGKPIGLQDQYAVALGGSHVMHFRCPDEVEVRPWPALPETMAELEKRLLLFFTNQTRKAEQLLAEQEANTARNLDVLRTMKALASEGCGCLESGDLDRFGKLLHEGWELKKRLHAKISNGEIDRIYSAGREAGALGGKITGAGGGGFLLFYCPPDRQAPLRQTLRDLRELPFKFESAGTQIVFSS